MNLSNIDKGAHKSSYFSDNADARQKRKAGGFMKLELEAIHLPACGLDVHKDVIEACVFDEDGNGILKTFSTVRSALFGLRDWIVSQKCLHVLMESTSVFWIPIYEILESVNGMDVGVGNARHMKNMPGRAKTDKSDAGWVAKLSAMGLIRKSFVVGRKFRELREYTRHHKKLVEERARHINRIEKLLQMNGFKLSSVLSDITGASGLRLLGKLRDKGSVSLSDVTLALDPRCRKPPEEIESAINGEMKLTSRVLIGLMLKKLESCNNDIAEVYNVMIKLSEPYESTLQIIDSIPGIGVLSSIYILAEIGDDLSSFRTEKHFTAWAGLAPKDDESAGKLKSSKTKKANRYIKTVMVECAWAVTKTRGARVSNWYWRSVGRLGKKKAITGVARRLFIYIYVLLKNGELYDRSLDEADTERLRAQKLESARKLVGQPESSDAENTRKSAETITGRKTQARPRNDSSILAGESDTPPDSPPKKRGRPRKATLEFRQNTV